MKFNTLTCFLVAFSGLAFASLVKATPLSRRDVIVPRIITPNASTVWTIGQVETVTWDTSNFPPDSQITNPIGQVILGYLENNRLHLDFDHPLVSGFKLRDGSVQLTVPSVEPRDNYIIVLYGDSGNTSPAFTIMRIAGPNGSSSSSSSSGSSSITSSGSLPSQSVVQSSSSSAPSPALNSASILAYISSVRAESTSASSTTSSTSSASYASASTASQQTSGTLSLWRGSAAWMSCISFIILLSRVTV